METPPPPSPWCFQQPIFPKDVIEEILSWLPIKTLLQFRCVCRSWKSIISDSKFVKLHLQRSPKIANIILTREKMGDLEGWDILDYCVTSCSVSSLISFPSPTISENGCYVLGECHWAIGSSNGLVCLVAPNSSLKNAAGNGYQFRFWNPATRMKSQYSPSLFVDLDTHYDFGFGFGYDLSSDTYKVVVVIVDRKAMEDSEKTKVKVHTMGDTFWRDIGSFPALPVENEGGVYVNGSGTLNWLGLRKLDGVMHEQLVIVSLDLGKETHKQFLLPDGLDDVSNVQPILGILMDCLCLSGDDKRTHFALWQMKDYGVEKSWTRLMNVSYQHLQVHNFPLEAEDLQLMPVCGSENGHVLVLLSAVDEELAIIRYDCRDDRVEHAMIHGEKVFSRPKDYIQSLALPL